MRIAKAGAVLTSIPVRKETAKDIPEGQPAFVEPLLGLAGANIQQFQFDEKARKAIDVRDVAIGTAVGSAVTGTVEHGNLGFNVTLK